MAYLRKHPDTALLYRFSKAWVSAENVLQVDDTAYACTRTALCLMHNERLVYIQASVKTFAMDVYLQLRMISLDYLHHPTLLANMLKHIPERRASIDTPLSQNTVFEQKLLKNNPDCAHIFAYGTTILMDAARYNYIDVLHLCLRAGANPNARRKLAFPTPRSRLENALCMMNSEPAPYDHVLYFRGSCYYLHTSECTEKALNILDKSGQRVCMRWEDISNNDYVIVSSMSEISGYAMISYFKYGIDASYYASMDTAFGLALSFNHPDCVRALLNNGANPHLHKPGTGSVLTSVFAKGHQKALDAFMQAFERFADVKPVLEMILDKLPVYGGPDDGSINRDKKIVDALVASRQYRYLLTFLSQMPNDCLFAYALHYYPRFLRAAICYPNHAELERMQVSSSYLGKAVMTHCQLHAVDVARAFALTMPGLLQQLPQYPDLVLRYLRLSKPFSKEDVCTLQMFFTSVIKKPRRHHAARVYYNRVLL